MTRKRAKSVALKKPVAVPHEDVDRLVGYIRSAARLRSEILPFAKDHKRKADGITVHYAFDTNVLKLFVNPSRMGPRSEEGGGGYGVIFDDDDDDSARALGAAISRFAFYRLIGERPLLLLPGHDVEARIIYDAILGRTGRARSRADKQRETLKSNLEQLGSIVEIEDRIKWVETHAPAFFRIFSSFTTRGPSCASSTDSCPMDASCG